MVPLNSTHKSLVKKISYLCQVILKPFRPFKVVYGYILLSVEYVPETVCALQHYLAWFSKLFSKIVIIISFTNKQVEAQANTVGKWQNLSMERYRNIFLPLFHRINTDK